MPNGAELQGKYDRLKSILAQLPSLAVGLSGGVDSALLLAAAVEALGDRVVALTADSPLHPSREVRAAIETGGLLKVRHILIRTEEMHQALFRANARDRCYHCKHIIFTRFRAEAACLGIDHLAHGANLDDLSDYRPGLRAAAECMVRAPLVEAGLSKAEIRRLAHGIGLPNWNRPAMACLASRIAYGTALTRSLLARVEVAENLLADLGFRGARVRCHGAMARIELASVEDMQRALSGACRPALVQGMTSAGFTFITLDLEGYRQGSLNAAPETGATS